ncbi:MAG: archaeal proteasome endopeptidase complex subunit beta [Candidatus Methanomethylicia archaeon]
MKRFNLGPAQNMILKGTTTVGVVCEDGIILAADKRATAGYYIASKRVKKIFKIDDYIAGTMAGGVADAQHFLEAIRYMASLYKYNNKRPISVKSAATLASNILFNMRPYVFLVESIIAGVDNQGPSMYSIDFFGTITQEQCIGRGSGSPIALGVLESEFKPRMNVSAALPIIIKALNAALKRDPFTGEGIDIVVITKKEGYHELSEDDLKSYL